MKIFIAFINNTANKINMTTPKKIALNGVVAELTWRRILITFNNFCISDLIPYGLQEYKPLLVIMWVIPNRFMFTKQSNASKTIGSPATLKDVFTNMSILPLLRYKKS